MSTRGDLLLYHGVEPVPGKIVSYAVDGSDWIVGIELTRPVAAIFMVKINDHPSEDVAFYGKRYVRAVIPTRARSGSSAKTLPTFLSAARVQVIADAYLRPMADLGDARQTMSMALGFGLAPVISDGMEEALQRAVRFLVMSSDPLIPNRGGGLLSLKRQGLGTESVATRLVSMACDRYNRYVSAGTNSSRWRVSRVTPSGVKLLTWSDLKRELGLTALLDTSGALAEGFESDESVLMVKLRHLVVRGDTSVQVASAVTL